MTNIGKKTHFWRIAMFSPLALGSVTVNAQEGGEAAEQTVSAPVSPAPSKARPAEMTRMAPFNYPAQAVRKGQEGRVEYRYSVNVKGRAVDCVITRSSGHRLLDEETCKSLTKHARFRPAHDENGDPVLATYSGSRNFQLD